MKFHYTASQPDGKITEGEIETPDYEGVLRYIASKGLQPVSVKALKDVEIGGASFLARQFQFLIRFSLLVILD